MGSSDSRWIHTALAVLLLASTVASAQDRVYPPVVTEDGQVYEPGSGVSWPKPIKQVDPQYTDAAKQAGIQGIVRLKAVVEADGSVDRIAVTKSLDTKYGLDQAAIAAASSGSSSRRRRTASLWRSGSRWNWNSGCTELRALRGLRVSCSDDWRSQN